MNNLNPSKILLFSLSTWLIIFTIIPYKYYFNESPNEAIFFALLCFFAFFLGTFFCNDKISDNEIINTKNVKLIFNISFLLGVIGVLFRLYERIFLDSVLMYDNFTEYRFESLQQEDQLSIAGVLGSLFYPFGLSALLIYIYYNKIIYINKLPVYAFGSFFPIEAIFLGGRLNIIVFSLILFFAFQINSIKDKGKLILPNLRNSILVISIFFLFSLYSLNIVLTRFDQMGFDFTNYLNFLEISRNLEISSYFYNFADQRNFDLTSTYFFILVEMMHYYVSGLVEFIKLYNFNLSGFDPYFGSHQFNVFLKFFGFLGFDTISFMDTHDNHHQIGQYTSFLGPAYIDFGKYSIFYLFLLGYVSKKIYFSMSKGLISGQLLYPYVLTVVILSPMNHFFMQQYLYIFTAIIITITMFKIRL